MSYIDEALHKAQKEKDSRYAGYSNILSSATAPPVKPKRKWMISAILSVIVVVSVVFSFAVYYIAEDIKSENSNHNPPQTMSQSKSHVQIVTIMREERSSVESENVAKEKPPVTAASAPPKGKVPSADVAELYKEALQQQQNKNLLTAEILYKKIIELAPKHVQALNNLGVIYMSQKKNDKALRFFDKAIAAKGDYVDPYYNLACLYAQYDVGNSLQFLKKAISMNSEVKKWAQNDNDLKKLHKSPEFRKLLGTDSETTAKEQVK
jgi:tetratricopeptide (TPR) repeat protein